jgi:hypothetical protein
MVYAVSFLQVEAGECVPCQQYWQLDLVIGFRRCFFILPPTIRIVLAGKIPVLQMILLVIRLSVSAGPRPLWASSIKYSLAARWYLLAGTQNPVDRLPLASFVGNVPNGIQ